jgi:ferredoxin-NADP reductase
MMFTPDRVVEFLVPLSASLFMACLTAYVALLAFREFSATRLARATAGVQQQLFREQVLDLSDRRKREQLKAERTWDGFRKFVIARKVKEAADICSFYLEPHDRKPLPPFLPGQYLTFRLNIPGQPKPVIRCYSLSDSPKAEYFRVTIKRIGPPPNKPDQPPGLSSSYFHDQLEEGDIVDVKAPSGAFFMDPREEFPAVLIGGGIGLTPMVSMLNAITEAGAQRDVYYFYGLRHRDEHVMGDHVRQIAADNPNVQLHVCYSDARAGIDKEGHDYQHGERVSIDLFKRVLPSNQCHYYLCGPPPMMEALVKGLEEWGVPEDHIHFEAFGPASVKKAAPVAAGEAGKYSVAFARSDKKIMWDGKQTLLEVAEANGVRLDFGCRAGNCGTCITAVKEGTVNYPTKPAAAIEAGSCLACVALPASNLIVDG